MKKLLVLLASALLSAVAFPAIVDIGSASDFASVIPTATPDNTYRLTADLDFSEVSWTPCDFAAELDGNEKTVTGLTQPLFATLSGSVHDLTLSGSRITQTTTTTTLPFGCLVNALSGATVEDCRIVDCTCTTTVGDRDQRFGAVAGATVSGSAKSVIRNITVAGCALGHSAPRKVPYVGGILGAAQSDLDISDCKLVKNGDAGNTILGGASGGILGAVLVGGIAVTIDNCSVSDAVVRSLTNAGGIVGTDAVQSTATVLTIRNCTSEAEVSAETTSPACAGGILGKAWRCGTVAIFNCVNKGTVSVPVALTDDLNGAGGIVGYALSSTGTYPVYLTIENCLNAGSVISLASNAGGIVGLANQMCMQAAGFTHRFVGLSNRGAVSAAANAGGIVGTFFCSAQEYLEMNSLANAATVTATGSRAGGLIGRLVLPASARTIGFGNALQMGDVSAADCAGSLVGWSEGGFTERICYEYNSSTVLPPSYTTGLAKVTYDLPSTVVRGSVSVTGEKVGKLFGYSYTPAPTLQTGFDREAVVLSTGLDVALTYPEATKGETIAVYGNRNATTTMNITPYYFLGGELTVSMDEFSALGPDDLTDGTVLTAFNAYATENDLAAWTAGDGAPYMVFEDSCGAGEFTYAVRFLGWEDEVLKEETVAYDGTATPPEENPTHAGWTFTGWDRGFVHIVTDTDIRALWTQGELEHFTVTFKNADGTVLKEESVLQGSAANPPDEDPSLPGKVFTGWDVPFDNIQADTVVTAVYVDRDYMITDAVDFAEKINASANPAFVYHLSQDLVLENWQTVDFPGNLSGDGHAIKGLTGPLFGILSGTIENAVIDGETDGAPTQITGIASDFGLVAVTNCGGCVRKVLVRNFGLTTDSNATQKHHGFFSGVAMDGAVFEGCETESSCVIRQRACYVGGIAGFTAMSDGWLAAAGSDLLTIAFCTNRAEIISTSSGRATVGGILGAADAFSATILPRTMLTNCVNFANIYSVYYAASGYFGGIVGERNGNPSQVAVGSLEICDCVNYGDLGPQGTTGCFYGGALGYSYRLAVGISCFQNFGRVGSETNAVGGAALTEGGAGGFIGVNGLYTASASLYGNNPIRVTDSANYGEVIGGKYAGGFISGFTPANADNSIATFVNCANYGTVRAVAEGGLSAQAIALVSGTVTPGTTRIYGCMNCFFADNDLVGESSEVTLVMSGSRTAKDVGYSPFSAAKALTKGAEELEVEPWVVGKVGDGKSPVLKAFCAVPCVQGMSIIVR